MRLSKVIKDLIRIKDDYGDMEVSVVMGDADFCFEILEIYMSCAETVVIRACDIADYLEDTLEDANNSAGEGTGGALCSNAQGNPEDSKGCDMARKQRRNRNEEYTL